MLDYAEFIQRKSQIGDNSGFEPIWLPEFLFPFQSHLDSWAIKKGRALIAADTGLGKTPMQLVWGQNVIEHTNRPVLLATPLAVGKQTLREAEKFGIAAKRTKDGVFTGEKCVWITNYEQLEKYNPKDFGGFIGDESSGVKDAKSERRKIVTEFTREMKYRLLCTATAAPNDYHELGTSSEILGDMGYRDMLTTFFKQESQDDYLGWGRSKYRFLGHAEQPFWKWVCSWARTIRKPSDLGFDDTDFILPELIENEIVVQTSKARPGMLYSMPAQTLQEQRQERRLSIDERCGYAADISRATNGPTVTWCELNDEADRLEKMLAGSQQISGSMSDERKEEIFEAFSSGQLKDLIIKPKIGCWGLNWQHCNTVNMFPSHSFEQYYQAIRRCWRYPQKNPVTVNTIVNEGEVGVVANVKRKAEQCSRMFDMLIKHMNDAIKLDSGYKFNSKESVPSWL